MEGKEALSQGSKSYSGICGGPQSHLSTCGKKLIIKQVIHIQLDCYQEAVLDAVLHKPTELILFCCLHVWG